MSTLFLDIASHEAVLACVTEDAVSALHTAEQRISDSELLPLVENLLSQANWTYEDLTQIACIVGPGGFTSLRVAVSFANALSYALKIPSAGIHLSDLYYARAEEEDVYWLHSTKKTELFVRGFGEFASDTSCMQIDACKELLPKGVKWIGELLSEHREALNLEEQSSLHTIEEILPQFLKDQQYNESILLPWYGREG